MTNYKALFGLRVLKSILASFVESFLVLYFLDISDRNILPLGIYKLISVITIYTVIFLVRNITKTKHRTSLMRIGIVLDFIYFFTIILLRENIINYIYLIGLLYGLEEGFYFSVYNILESDGIKNNERAKFIGTYTATNAVFSIVFPLIFGSLIYTTGFIKSLSIVLIIIILRMVLSFYFKDKNIPKTNKVNIKEYINLTKNDKRFRTIYKIVFISGLTYSEGAFSYIVTIYIIKVFSNSFSLGVFTSIFSVITCLIGILFAKCIKKEHYVPAIKVTMTLTIITLCIMILKCNATTIIIFNLCQTISRNLISLINGNSQQNLSNIKKIKMEYKSEYWLAMETSLVISRVISSLIFILMAYTNSSVIIMVFVIFLILYANNSVKLQKYIEEDKIYEHRN